MGTNLNLINPKDLKNKLYDSDTRIVDCRFDLFNPDSGRCSYEEGHIGNAAYADLNLDLSSSQLKSGGRHPLPDLDEFKKKLESWGISNDSYVVVYDQGNGGFASRLWWLLKCWLGHQNVVLLDGGLKKWIDAGLPLRQGQATIDRGFFDAESDDEATISGDKIFKELVLNKNMLLIDARDQSRFKGDFEPIDKKGGHIPGAINLPFEQNLNNKDEFIQSHQIKNNWDKILGKNSAKLDFSVMCGSGVTACHLVFSAEIAGLKRPKLYVGSWSDWIEHPKWSLVDD